jgi:hypothetical protein
MQALQKLPRDLYFRMERILYFPFSRAIVPPQVNGHVQERMRQTLQEDANQLRAFTGQKFENWSV